MNQDIQKILEVSINAPSGSNSQPWKFKVKDGLIQIIALPEKDHPVLNFRNRGTLVAIGALIENIRVVAGSLGYQSEIKIFSNTDLIAEVSLEKVESLKTDSLAEAVNSRSTNRKPYERVPLSDEKKKFLLESVSEVGSGDLRFVENEEDLRVLGLAGSVNEIVMLENEKLHKLFFDEVVWNESGEKLRKSGLYLKTMELKLPQQAALKIFKYWLVMRLFNKIGVARQIAKGNAVNYSACSAMGAIIVNDDDQDFVQAGRLLERVWLKAITMGLSLHLITGVLFLWQNIRSGKNNWLSLEHVKLIKQAYGDIASRFNVEDKKLVGLMFRVGRGDEPSARSIKVKPDIEYI